MCVPQTLWTALAIFNMFEETAEQRKVFEPSTAEERSLVRQEVEPASQLCSGPLPETNLLFWYEFLYCLANILPIAEA